MPRKKNNLSPISPESFMPTSLASPEELITKLQNGAKWTSFSEGEKFLVIKHYLDKGTHTIAEIAQELGLSVNTVLKYKDKIRQLQAHELAALNLWELGGDLYNKYLAAYRIAMQKRQPKAAAYILDRMVSTLQSMGLIYKAPTRRQIQAAIQQHTVHSYDSSKNYAQFKKSLEGQEQTYEQVIQELMEAISKDESDSEEEIVDIEKTT